MNKLELILINGDKIICNHCWFEGNDVVYRVASNNVTTCDNRIDRHCVSSIQPAE